MLLWIKALHVIFVISWMASMLYLPRLFVYHTEVKGDGAEHQRFCTMEKRLYGLMTVAMIGTWVFGLWTLMAGPEIYMKMGWLHAKLALVVALSGYHGFLKGRLRAFANGNNSRSARYYRIANEVPAVLMVIIVILVIVKPF